MHFRRRCLGQFQVGRYVGSRCVGRFDGRVLKHPLRDLNTDVNVYLTRLGYFDVMVMVDKVNVEKTLFKYAYE